MKHSRYAILGFECEEAFEVERLWEDSEEELKFL